MPSARSLEIYKRREKGEAVEELSGEYGVSPISILNIVYSTKSEIARIEGDELRKFLWYNGVEQNANARIYNALRRAGISTIEELASVPEDTHIRWIKDSHLAAVRKAAQEAVKTGNRCSEENLLEQDTRKK